MSIHNSKQSAMEAKLTTAFAPPQRLEVSNESHLHAGHHHEDRGHHEVYDGTGETHFRIRIVADAFAGMSRIERHRAINALLKEELESGVHALALEPSAPPGEATRR
ncbi:BolA family transcriptional regulator [Brucella intermedia 229E]|uniref:BolA family transcriptional regulator n=1 Tax=Brucella intermedia 229E TaxID=1337887 RepID=U4VBM1_9HYPH|nr:BolA family transcriptional regulator [Brucella intermedia 229E]